MSNATSDAMSDGGTLAIFSKCGVVLAVKVTMELTVEDPQAFVNNPNSARAVAKGIADTLPAVDPDDVEVVLSVAPARRLGNHAGTSTTAPTGSAGTSTSGTVIVDATIQAEDAASVQTLQTAVQAISETAMTQSLNVAITDAGIAGVTVDVAAGSLAAEPAAPAGTDSTATTAPAAVPSTDSAKMVTASKFVAAVALQQLFLLW